MKARLKYGLGGYSGNLDGMVFYRERCSDMIIARRWVIPRYSAENERLGLSTKGILALQPSNEYKNDLRTYLLWYKSSKYVKSKPLRNWVNAYMHLMYNMAKAYPDIDLKSITRDDIFSLDLPCISVKRAVEAGLLPQVYNWESLNAIM